MIYDIDYEVTTDSGWKSAVISLPAGTVNEAWDSVVQWRRRISPNRRLVLRHARQAVA